MEYIINVENLEIIQDYVPILKNVTFKVHKGEFVYLVGKTGSGKSSILKALYADLAFEKGNVEVVGMKINSIPLYQVSQLRRKLGIIFQDFELLDDRTISENLQFVMRATGWTDNGKILKRQAEVLMRVGLGSSGSKYPHQLSGGEQQRIAIARALINEPMLLIADEPTGNLDPETGREIMKLFFEINRSGTSVLMATHNLRFTEDFPGRIFSCEGSTLVQK